MTLDRAGTGDAERCITCGDLAVVATVVEVRGLTASVEADGCREDVAIDLVEPVRPGDLLLCHAGIALERVTGGGEAA